jgi:hypothetical protein
LSQLEEVSFLPLFRSDIDLTELARREHLLRAELVQNGQTIASARLPLMRPYAWEISEELPYISNRAPGPLDPDSRRDSSPPGRWKPLADTSFTPFGVIDFGVHTTGASLHPQEYRTIYARTRVLVPRSGTYLFKVQSDDSIRLWADNRGIFRYDNRAFMPATRSASRLESYLAAGEHQITMRVNQCTGPWQGSVRIRTEDDDLSDVVGLPLKGESP